MWEESPDTTGDPMTAILCLAALCLTLATVAYATHAKRKHAVLARSSRGRGFTLIELMIVLAIIGILAAIVMPALVGTAGSQAKAEADMRAYVTQLFPGATTAAVTCATSTSSRYARCTANVAISEGRAQLIEAECGVAFGTQGCGPVRGARGSYN